MLGSETPFGFVNPVCSSTRTAHAVGSPGACLRINRRAQDVSPVGAFAVMDSSYQLILQSHMTRTAHAAGSPGACLRINRRAQDVSPVGAFLPGWIPVIS